MNRYTRLICAFAIVAGAAFSSDAVGVSAAASQTVRWSPGKTEAWQWLLSEPMNVCPSACISLAWTSHR